MISLTGPTFDRPDSFPPVKTAPTDWDGLRKLSREELIEMGCRHWSYQSSLVLFPSEWYSHIPEGFEVVTITNKVTKFKPNATDNDTRFGCLAFGILASAT